MKRESIKHFKPRKGSNERIQFIIKRLGQERGLLSEQKVFQILETWLAQRLILGYHQSQKGGYDNYIRHVDGWFMTLTGETVEFQIKSSQKAAQKHKQEYPEIPVIVVTSGISLEDLDKQMKESFKDKLPETAFRNLN